MAVCGVLYASYGYDDGMMMVYWIRLEMQVYKQINGKNITLCSPGN